MRPRIREVCIASTLAVLSVGLLGASCDKKSVAEPTEAKEQPNVPFESPGSSGAASAATPAAAKPADPPAKPGDRLAALSQKLASPCGKAESLAKSLQSSPGCKRNPFAQKFVQRLISLDLADDEIQTLYDSRYSNKEPSHFSFNDSPHEGNPNAPVVIVEFFDYACPHCKAAMPILENVVQAYSSDVVLYFKHFPLHAESPAAARAAVAAQKQGKFLEMHKILFANQGAQTREDLFKYAQQIGLDMQRFQSDFESPATAAKVAADKAEGEAAQLSGTPTIYVDGRKYQGGMTVEDFGDWIAEDKEVSR